MRKSDGPFFDEGAFLELWRKGVQNSARLETERTSTLQLVRGRRTFLVEMWRFLKDVNEGRVTKFLFGLFTKFLFGLFLMRQKLTALTDRICVEYWAVQTILVIQSWDYAGVPQSKSWKNKGKAIESLRLECTECCCCRWIHDTDSARRLCNVAWWKSKRAVSLQATLDNAIHGHYLKTSLAYTACWRYLPMSQLCWLSSNDVPPEQHTQKL